MTTALLATPAHAARRPRSLFRPIVSGGPARPATMEGASLDGMGTAMDARNDQQLVEAVRGGDPAAYAELFDRYADRCFDVARRIVHDDGRAADVVQEVFTVAWQQLAALRDPAAFGGWVLRSSRNKALNVLRDEGRQVATDGSDDALRDLEAPDSVEADIEALDHRDLVWAASAALGERDASVLDLHLRHHLSVPEIAEELGVTTNNAHQLLHRMKQRLGSGIRAYVLVRGGDASCSGLRASLASAGVTRFGPEAVKVIGTHVRDCEDCEGRQAAVLAPEAMFAAVPLLVMAPALRAHAASALDAVGSAGGGGGTGAAAGDAGSASSPTGAVPSTGSEGGGGAGEGAGAQSTGGGGDGGGGRSRALLIGGAVVFVVLAALVGFLVLGGDDGDAEEAGATTTTTVLGGGAEDEGTTTTEAAPTSTTTEAAPSTTVPASGGLEGSWVADASDILAANTANVGGTGGLSCSGPITMTFTGEGTYDRSGTVTCAVGGMTASGTISTAGSYAVDGGQLVVTGTISGGRMALGGTEIPTPDSFGDGTADFDLSGDTLTITFTDTSVGTVTQTYERA